VKETDLLTFVKQANHALPESVVIAPGDDMAMVRLGDPNALIAVDQIIDQVHFDLANAPIEKIGRKAVTRNLSDIAAMAAMPASAVVAVALPTTMKQPDAQKLLDAIAQTGAQYGCPVVGGDISIHNGPLTISVTVLATPLPDCEPVTRGSARVGDAIYVSGLLGGSMVCVDGRIGHLDFEPRLSLSHTLLLNTAPPPSSMIDLSDGLARDLPRLVDHAAIDLSVLPVSPAAKVASAQSGNPAWWHAVADGEDYELLFTASPTAFPSSVFYGDRITKIGEVTDAGGILANLEGQRIDLSNLGWEHRA